MTEEAMSGEVLKACPCAEDKVDEVDLIWNALNDHCPAMVSVVCGDCGATSPGFESEDLAIAWWNARPATGEGVGALGDDLAAARKRNLILRCALIDAANQCDAWAKQSRDGGWSTHQVEANKQLANKLRKYATSADDALADLKDASHD